MSRSDPNIRHLLKDLGRATQRGVRKCPKCETYNGTRGSKCKNKLCDHVFRLNVDNCSKSGHKINGKSGDQLELKNNKSVANGLESIRCITANSSSNIYSVRVRDRGPDYRGFVEVPIIRGLDGTSDPSINASFIVETTARCFVEVCGSHKVVLPITSTHSVGSSAGHQSNHQKSGSSSNASNIRLSLIESCLHIKHSVKCESDAKPLALKNSVLNQLPITDDMRQQIAELAFDTPGPLVQRVSKTSMVVKCRPNNKQPLGYLHCSFAQPNETSTSDPSKANSSSQFRFSCSCKAFKSFKCVNNQTNNKCINNNINNIFNKTNDQILNDKTYELFGRKCVHYYACICAFASDSEVSQEFKQFITKELPEFVSELDENDNNCESCGQKVPESSTEDMEAMDKSCANKQMISSEEKRNSEAINTRKLIDRGILSESDISINFIDWLSSVTELINQTMHYQLSGKVEPLIFKIPQGYFDCLQQRIATGLRKKRLPNMTTVFTRKDRPPLGTYTKYTYLITNIIHLKQIFDTSKQLLEIQQNFVQNRDGSYDFLHTKASNDLCDTTSDGSALDLPQNSDNLLIKPNELKTFLKVGLMSASEPKESAIPFVIEWIPDILPKCHFGELKIELQYGLIRNGKIENNCNN